MPSRLKSRQNLLAQRRIEVLRNFEATLLAAEDPWAAGLAGRNQSSHRLTGLRDDDLFACADAFEQTRKMSLRLVNVDSFHISNF